MSKKAVILAGGLGMRLRPFTQVVPKPLLPIGESSVIEIQINNLVKYGFDHIFIATNYRAEYIKAFIGDGSQYGAKVDFSKEEKPLGTCGPLTLLKSELTEPFLMINGDILTTLDFNEAYKFASKIDANITVVTKNISTPFNFGSVQSDGIYITQIEEKPNLMLEILAGIYIFKPAIFQLIPENCYFGMDDLIKLMLAKKIKVAKYLMEEYWLDIGQIHDYNNSEEIYKQHFSNE